MSEAVVVIGGGEHARVVGDALRLRDLSLLGYIDPAGPIAEWSDATHLGDDTRAQALIDDGAVFIVGVGAVSDGTHRRAVAVRYEALGARWLTLVHPGASVAPDVSVGDGAFVADGVVINRGARLGRHVIVNSGAIVEHDVVISDHAIIGPGAVLGGGAMVGSAAIIGLAAAVRDHVTIGAEAVVGMGAVVVSAVPAGVTVVGVPAREWPAR